MGVIKQLTIRKTITHHEIADRDKYYVYVRAHVHAY